MVPFVPGNRTQLSCYIRDKQMYVITNKNEDLISTVAQQHRYGQSLFG